MSVGRVVARLRSAHGESLREAAERTGVSRSTIARIEKGEVRGNLHQTLLKVAQGYQVPLEYLLTGEHRPRCHSGGTPRQLSPEERSSLLFGAGRDRMRRALSMLSAPGHGEVTLEEAAAAVGFDLSALEQAVLAPGKFPDQLVGPVCDQMALLTGLSPLWFRWGLTEEGAPAPETEWAPYMRLVEKGCQAGLHPNLIDMAIEVLRLNAGAIPTFSLPLQRPR